VNGEALLNARIGRTWPGPAGAAPAGASPRQARASNARIGGRHAWAWFARPAGAPTAATGGAPPRQTMPSPIAPLLALLAASWSHLLWMARRLTDGSDEPWGLLALVTVLALLARDRRELQASTPRALAASGLLAAGAAAAGLVVPPIFAAALAMLALAVLIASALPRRPAAPVFTLLLLALPVIASLQFYFGFPLRLATAHLAAPLLAAAGIDAQAAGAALVWRGQTILVDPPCAGIGMLWVGSWAAALASYLHGASARRTFVNGCFAAGVVFAANALRNVALFFPEAGLVAQPAWLHPAIGLAAFAVALAPVLAFAAGGRRHAAGTPGAAERAAIARQATSGSRRAAAAASPRGAHLVGQARAEAALSLARLLFVGACLAAAVLPLLGERLSASGAAGREPAVAVDARSTAIEWPTHFRGQPLTQLPPTALEARFAARFPGAVARFTDGGQLLIVRQVRRPTRLLHPASDCFRAAGYAVAMAQAAVDGAGVRWRCFVATRADEKLRVCERIGERFDAGAHDGWTDVSAWFWGAQWSPAPAWWAVTVVTPLDAGARG
jgi:exosortase/archaeosortase family protein